MDLILPALISFAVTFAAIPFTIKIAKIFNLIDNPETRPHPAHTQKRIVPRAGGLAVFFGITIAAIIFTPFGTQAVGILIGLSILLIVGLLDDMYKNFSVNALYKQSFLNSVPCKFL